MILLPEFASFIYSYSLLLFYYFLSMRKLLILIALISLTSCTLGGDKTTPTQTGVTVVPQTTYQEDIASTSAKISDTPEFNSCIKQQVGMCAQSVGMQVAQKSRDPLFCKELSTAEQQASCEFAITIVTAREKNDVKLCDSITNTNYKTQCKSELYRQEAITKNDITLCDKIDTGSATASDKNAPGMMQMNEQKNQCMMQVIMSASGATTSDCKQLSNTGSITMCQMMMTNKPQMALPTPVGKPR